MALALLFGLGAVGSTVLLAQGRPAQGLPAVQPAPAPTAETDLSLFREGAQRFLAEDYPGAERSFRHLLREYPDSALATQVRYLAVVARNNGPDVPNGDSGRLAEARRVIEAVLAGVRAAEARQAAPGQRTNRGLPPGPDNPKVVELLRQYSSLCKQGKYSEAEAHARAALELDPENPAARDAVQFFRSQFRPAESRTIKGRVQEEKIEQVLRQPISLNYQDVPLAEVLEDVRAFHGLNLVIDRQALEEAGISLRRPVNVHLREVSFQSALKVVLHAAQLAYMVRDGVLVISTPTVCAGKPVRKVYPVGKLLGRDANGEVLIRLLTRTVQPASWDVLGGAGAVEFYPLGRALVVSQTPDVQEQIEEFLASLRVLAEEQAGR
jgi:tetratricopeptide (TPR) repeat protein